MPDQHHGVRQVVAASQPAEQAPHPQLHLGHRLAAAPTDLGDVEALGDRLSRQLRHRAALQFAQVLLAQQFGLLEPDAEATRHPLRGLAGPFDVRAQYRSRPAEPPGHLGGSPVGLLASQLGQRRGERAARQQPVAVGGRLAVPHQQERAHLGSGRGNSSQPSGPWLPAGYSSSGTSSAAKAASAGATSRQHWTALAAVTDSDSSPSSAACSTRA